MYLDKVRSNTYHFDLGEAEEDDVEDECFCFFFSSWSIKILLESQLFCGRSCFLLSHEHVNM